MTGYAQKVRHVGGAPLKVALRSVNRRSLEITPSLPPFLAPFEPQIREWIGERVERGALHLQIDWPLPLPLSPNLPLLASLKGVAEGVAEATGLPFPEAFRLACRGHEGALTIGGEASIDEGALEEVVKGAVEALVEMRRAEGRTIGKELLERCSNIKSLIDSITPLLEGHPERVRSRLIERLKGWEVEEERLVREAALLAERGDVSEELSRLSYHLEALRGKLASTDRVSGKTCEFIVQEMGREINTLGAKAQEAKVSEGVVAIKGELERIKEQLANVE
ncbi:MAG: DUF1732 domain-containing protein [Parachlamydiales bacterium]